MRKKAATPAITSGGGDLDDGLGLEAMSSRTGSLRGSDSGVDAR